MQLSARILTALAVLAFAVAIVAGAQRASDEVSAATGTIDALNVGACTTTNADVLNEDHCTQRNARYQGEELGDAIEVDKLYATYSHDPTTGAEAPRAIIKDGDLLRISITDKDRDRRDPVVITTDQTTLGGVSTDQATLAANPNARNGFEITTDTPPVTQYFSADAIDATTDTPPIPAVPAFSARGIVAASVFDDEDKASDLPALEQEIEFDAQGATGDTTFENSGTFQIVFEDDGTTTPDTDDVFKPIAPDGVVKFFGRVDDGLAADAGGDGILGFGPFKDLSAHITLDEDVISGGPDTPPAMVLQINVPDSAGADQGVQLQMIYYETSGIEYIQGGDKCFDDPDNTTDKTETADVNEADRAMVQAACTADEVGITQRPEGDTTTDVAKDNKYFVLHVTSDTDATEDMRNLALLETGRFTGVFQGYVRLTDADGDGTEGDGSSNWGLEKMDGAYDEDPANTGKNDAGASASDVDPNPTVAVLGVGDGPVTVTYKDTNGKDVTFDIEIDIGPPTITIDSPVHDSRSDDEKPSFIGSFNDADSGLSSDSFQLDVDNIDENTTDRTYPTPIIVAPSGVNGKDDGATAKVTRRQEYTGFDTTPQFGLIDHMDDDIYRPEDPEGSPTVADRWLSLEADDFADGATDGEFNGEIEVDFDEFLTDDDADDFVFNNAVDFQAIVQDLAGNVGFSDSNPSAPRFIDALGAEKDGVRADGDSDDANGKRVHNVLGIYSSHVVHIDDKDPVIEANKSVTGFYGLDDDDNLVRDRSSVMVVFDAPVDGDLIDTGTFLLEHDEATAIEIVDVSTSGKLVFLKLGEELASDAQPTLSIAEGREVEDLAGNLLTWQEDLTEDDATVNEIKLKDGILPVFTVVLSGGSGTGVGSEGPSKLTNAAMDISIASDEDINRTPNVNVVCSNIGWTDDGDDKGLNDFVNNRTGYEDNTSNEVEQTLMCGGAEQPTDFRHWASLSRPGNNWVYAWRNASTRIRELNDGKLVVVVWGRDRNTYEDRNSTTDKMVTNENWGSTKVEFVLDSTFNSPLLSSGGSVQPEPDGEVKEPRPFIYLDFAGENTSVDVTEFKVDGEDVSSSLESVGGNRFLYWPEALEFGTHKVAFDARDAADNEPVGSTSFEFKVTARDPFVIDLKAGWNAISFPADPVDTALDAVFTDESVDRVVGWNPMSSTGPWSIATRIDGVWTTSANFAPLTDVVVRYGYWVHSMAFVEQSVALKGPIDRETGSNPTAIGIQTIPGWNFVGVVDQDGDQTEGHFGDTLQRKEADLDDAEDVMAGEYLAGSTRAYTWDALANGYRILKDSDPVKIGDGIWVFFPDDTTVAP